MVDEPFEYSQYEAVTCPECGRRHNVSPLELSTGSAGVLYCSRCRYRGAVRIDNDGDTVGVSNRE